MNKLKQNVTDDRLTISQRITQSPSLVRESSDSISVDLLIDIFSRVPTKSIARFSCVSKFWAYILRRPDFTELFLSKSLTCPRILLSVEVNKELFIFSTPQLQNPDENSYVVATRYKSLPKYFPTGIYSQLCGFVFLRSRGRKAKTSVIYNPLTGESLTLPEVKGTGKKRSYFGFDPIKKEFKVLCMTFLVCGRPNTIRVLTLESGKHVWRTIQDPVFPHIPTNGEICINGVLYYHADLEVYSPGIVFFNVRSEKFGFVKLDKDMTRWSAQTLFNYKGKLGAVQDCFNWGDKEFVLWVLEDAGEHKWSKVKCVLPPSWGGVVSGVIVGMTATGEIVFWSRGILTQKYRLNRFYLYNVERKNYTRVNIKGLEEFKDGGNIVSTFLDYVENMKFM